VSGRLEARTEAVEITIGPSPYGPPPDLYRRFMPGVTHYYLDGEEITEDEYRRLLAEQVASR
jgi:hypothetical protein